MENITAYWLQCVALCSLAWVSLRHLKVLDPPVDWSVGVYRLKTNTSFSKSDFYLCIYVSGFCYSLAFSFVFAGYWSYYELCSERAAGAGKAKQRKAHARCCPRHPGAFENVSGGGPHLWTFQPSAHSDPQGHWAGFPAQRQHSRRHTLHLQASEVGQNGHPGETSGNSAEAYSFPQNKRHEPRRRLLCISAAYWQVLYCLMNSMLLCGYNCVVSDEETLLKTWKFLFN